MCFIYIIYNININIIYYMGVSKKKYNKRRSKINKKKNLKKTNKKRKTRRKNIKTRRRRKRRDMLRGSGWFSKDGPAELVEVPRPDYININCNIFSTDKAETFLDVKIIIDSMGTEPFWNKIQEAISNIELDELPREYREIKSIEFGGAPIDKNDMIYDLGIEDEATISVILAYNKGTIFEKRERGPRKLKTLYDTRLPLIAKVNQELINHCNKLLNDKYTEIPPKSFKKRNTEYLARVKIIEIRIRDSEEREGEVIFPNEHNNINKDVNISGSDIVITWGLEWGEYRIDWGPRELGNYIYPVGEALPEWRKRKKEEYYRLLHDNH